MLEVSAIGEIGLLLADIEAEIWDECGSMYEIQPGFADIPLSFFSHLFPLSTLDTYFLTCMFVLIALLIY